MDKKNDRLHGQVDKIVRICSECNGTGMEICTNPDHGFIAAMPGDVGRIGCPLCGYDEQCRIPNTKCYNCNGTGKL